MANDKNKKYTVLMFGHHTWSKLINSSFKGRNAQMLKALNKDDRIKNIVFINPYFYSGTILSLIKKLLINIVKSPFSPIINLKNTSDYQKIAVLDILHLKYFHGLKKYFFKIFKNQLRKAVNNNEENLIIWLYNPAEYEIFDLFPRALKIFDSGDNWMELNMDKRIHPWYKRSDMTEGYKKICSNPVILTIACAKEMAGFFLNLRKKDINILEVPSGIDRDLFSMSSIRNGDMPSELKGARRPIIGYVGVIQERFDMDLFKFLLNANPDYTFVVLGPIGKFRDFKFDIKAPNLVRIGSKKYSEIPRYIKNFDICIVPHKLDSMTASMSPMKLYEYLAMGKPVVTTPVGGIEKIAKYCNVAKDYKVFNEMIEKSLKAKNEDVSDIIIKNHSWEKRADAILRKALGE